MALELRLLKLGYLISKSKAISKDMDFTLLDADHEL